jgi:hypothetical protein
VAAHAATPAESPAPTAPSRDITVVGAANRIVLERGGGSLENYRIHHPPTLVVDGIKGLDGRVIAD